MKSSTITVILAVALLGLGTAVVLQHRQLASARQEAEAARAAAAQAAELKRENERLARANADATPDLSRAERNELLRLRAEVARLRQQVKQATGTAPRPQPSVPPPPQSVGPLQVPASVLPASDGFLPAEQWADVGLGTPEAAFQTLHWAMRHGNQDRMQQVMVVSPDAVPEGATLIGVDMLSGGVPPVASGSPAQPTTTALAELAGTRIVSRQDIAPDEVQLTVENQHADGTRLPAQMHFRRVGNEWKLAPTVTQWPPASSQGESPP